VIPKYWHCAGGCHLTHDASAPPGQYDSLCLLTRLVTVGLLVYLVYVLLRPDQF
jgi:K+-transporting ATPase KdpF subunit